MESAQENIIIEAADLNLYFGEKQVLFDINMKIPRNQVTAIIGPSGCGKSALLRCFNRMNDIEETSRTSGQVYVAGENIYAKKLDTASLRQNVGLVFQQPNPFPISVFENIIYGLRVKGVKENRFLREVAEECLKKVALWSEVKDNLEQSALSLSGGQQQRLMLARALAIEPKILLMDEPTSSLDPTSTLTIEELIQTLAEDCTLVIVTHNMQQAARVSDKTAFLYMGELVEFDDTRKIFTSPSNQRTEDYITGRYG